MLAHLPAQQRFVDAVMVDGLSYARLQNSRQGVAQPASKCLVSGFVFSKSPTCIGHGLHIRYACTHMPHCQAVVLRSDTGGMRCAVLTALENLKMAI